jgi:hypothetical protein
MGVSDIGSHLLLYGGSKTPLGMYDFEAEDLRAILSTSEDSASSAVSHAVCTQDKHYRAFVLKSQQFLTRQSFASLTKSTHKQEPC